MTLIKNGVITTNDWQHLPDDAPLPASGKVTVTLHRWLSDQSLLRDTVEGIRLAPEDDLGLLKDALPTLKLVVLDMTAFTDGRSFSQARLLRDRLGFAGEIRVRGDFLRDQMFYLSRSGVTAFEFPEDTHLEDRLLAFKEFTVTYQAASDTPDPLYRRRA